MIASPKPPLLAPSGAALVLEATGASRYRLDIAAAIPSAHPSLPSRRFCKHGASISEWTKPLRNEDRALLILTATAQGAIDRLLDKRADQNEPDQASSQPGERQCPILNAS